MGDTFIVNRNTTKAISSFTALPVLTGANESNGGSSKDEMTFSMSNINKYDIKFIIVYRCNMYWNSTPLRTIFKPNGEAIYGSSVEIELNNDILTVIRTADKGEALYIKVGVVC